MASDAMLPPAFFDRMDESDDALFYAGPRFVVHIDAATIAALTQAYAELLPAGADLLDLMSSWVSHLPEDTRYGRIAGLGMNESELAGNPRLSDFVVHDLNREPELPFGEGSFDAVVNAVSIQYLVRPVEVLQSCARVLRPGGLHLVALSHRCFPTKAVRAWHVLPPMERLELVASYFRMSGRYDPAQILDRSPEGADPLWIVAARRSA